MAWSTRQFVFIRIILLIFGSFIFCLLAAGCTTAPEPRVIAERVFAGDQLTATLTTYPGDPQEMTITSCKFSDKTVDDVEIEKIQIENRPGWRLRCAAPADADTLTLLVTVRYDGRRFKVEIPFRRRKTYVAHHSRKVLRWTTRRERIINLGPADLFLTRNP